MAGTRAGGRKAALTNIQRHGADFYSRIGAKGGKKCGPKGFALMPFEKVQAAGRLGGQRSRRGPNKNKQGEQDD